MDGPTWLFRGAAHGRPSQPEWHLGTLARADDSGFAHSGGRTTQPRKTSLPAGIIVALFSLLGAFHGQALIQPLLAEGSLADLLSFIPAVVLLSALLLLFSGVGIGFLLKKRCQGKKPVSPGRCHFGGEYPRDRPGARGQRLAHHCF